jgi:hypothetical protein
MEYIGNFSDWIRVEWIGHILATDGIKRPSGGNNPNTEYLKSFIDAGYDISKTYWHHYASETNTFPFEFEAPFDNDKMFMWWFIKMMPGGFMPMHRDPHVTEDDKDGVERYWIPLQDYRPGHIFIYDNSLITNYKMGDCFKYSSANEIHGAANISHDIRLTVQFTTHETAR